MSHSSYEAPEIGAMIDRMLRALVRRAGEGEQEAIEQLVQLGDRLPAYQARALVAGREFGYSLAELATATGTSRQAVSQRIKAGEQLAVDDRGRLVA